MTFEDFVRAYAVLWKRRLRVQRNIDTGHVILRQLIEKQHKLTAQHRDKFVQGVYDVEGGHVVIVRVNDDMVIDFFPS